MGTRVLLAEDEALIALSLADLLEAEGHEVALALDGEEALDVARRLGDRLQVLVTDLRMPRMGGEDLIRALRVDRPGLPVVVVTGSPPRGGEGALRSRAGGDGPLLLLGKPACCGQLAAALRRVVAAGAAPPAAGPMEAAADAPAPGAAAEAAPDDPTGDYARSFFGNDVFAFGPGARASASPGAAPSGAAGGDGVLVGGPGEAAWVEVGVGSDAHCADEAAGAAGRRHGDRVAVLFGDRVASRPDEGVDAAWAGVDLALAGGIEAPAPTGGFRTGQGHGVPYRLAGDGADQLAVGPPGDGDEIRDGGGGGAHPVHGWADRLA